MSYVHDYHDPETRASTLTPDMPVEKIPGFLITPLDWAIEAQKRAVEYIGCPESPWFTVEARRYLALDAEIRRLNGIIERLQAQLEEGTEIIRRYNEA